MKTHARAVVIGGGVVGVSTLYHLAKKGWSDVVLVERKELTSGSTWHAAGLLPLFNMSYSVGQIHKYSVGLYKQLEAETGQNVGFKQVTNIRLARTKDRWDEYMYYAGVARTIGVPLNILTPQQVKEIWPLCEIDGIIGAIPHLESQSMAGWVAALDGLPADRQFSVLSALSSRPDVLSLVSFAQTDFIPTLWKVVGDPTASPAFQKYARDVLEKLVPGATKKQPESELAAYARKFADRKARFLGAAGQPDGTPTTVPVWVWDAAAQKLVKQDGAWRIKHTGYTYLFHEEWSRDDLPSLRLVAPA